MKKHFLLFVVLSAVLALLLVSCSEAGSSDGGNSNGGKTVTYTVSFDSGEGSDVSPQSVQSGGKATRPADPVRSGYSFENWYSNAGFQTAYDFDQSVTQDITLYAAWHHELKSVIESGTVPADLSAYGALVRAILAPYAADAAIVAKYVDVTEQGTGDASSWANAAGDIKATVDGIGDAGANKIYLVLVASGTHAPAATLGMKNHAAIVGGWNEWEQSGTSTISGEDTRRVFYNDGIDRTALLYGVTIANGDSGSISGGGMRNNNSSPTLNNVTFVNNEANQGGGGMFNDNKSSPTLNNVTFSGNTADFAGGMFNRSNSSPTLINVTFVNNESTHQGSGGGGMFNQGNSSPTLINITFSGNTAIFGGGMYNSGSLLTLINVTFVNNKATGGDGGGMRNLQSSPTLNNVTFVNNEAMFNGGGMANNNNDAAGPTIVNTLFWNNTGAASQETAGQQIYMRNDGTRAENMTISFSLVQHGIGATTSATGDTDPSDGLGIDGGTASVTVTQAHNISGDPELAAALADNGGFVQTIALLDNSAAADAGAYVQRSGTPGSFTFYYSADAASWFSDAVLSSSGSAPPADALDLTAVDARGHARNDRPDIGAYEYGGTAP